MSPGADTTTKAPPTPKKSRQICRKTIEVEKKHKAELAVTTAVPAIDKAFTPYFSVSKPPRIARRTPGKATSHMRLLARVNPNPNSLISVGSNGGTACIANRKENWEKKLTSNAYCFSECIVHSFRPYVDMPFTDDIVVSSLSVVTASKRRQK